MNHILRPDHVAFHIGAHKTATTHLQKSIFRVRHKLAGMGVQYYDPNMLRGAGKTLVDRFGIKRGKNDAEIECDADVALRDLVWDGQRLVISEENFIGVLLGTDGNIRRPIYPNAAHRLSQLSSKITDQGIHVHLGVRDPAAFLNSGFSQAIRSKKAIALETYLRLNPMIGIDWAKLVARLRAAPGIATMTVWRHEDYATLFDKICLGLVGPDAASFVEPMASRIQVGLSGAAVEHLSRLGLPVRSKALIASAIEQYPSGPGFPPFDAFDADDHALSQEYYEDQLSQISQMANVTLLRP